MSPAPSFAHLPGCLTDFFRRSIVSTTPANDATDVAVGASITVKVDDAIISVKPEGAIEARATCLQLLHTRTDLRKVLSNASF